MSNKEEKAGKHGGRRPLVPRLRFPEFRETGEWCVSSIEKIATLYNGYAFKSATYVDKGHFKIITIGNVQAGKLASEEVKTISVLPTDIQPHQKLKIGDILVSMTGNVGRVCYVDIDNCLLNQRVGKLIPGGVNHDFFYHSINNDNFREEMQERAAGGAQGNLNSNAIVKYNLSIPATKKEQQKIADCLSSLDDLITLESQKLNALKTHKKGLMQQLFPAEGETVPRLRFPEFREAGDWEEKPLGATCEITNGKANSQDHDEAGIYPLFDRSEVIKKSNNYFLDCAAVIVPGEGMHFLPKYYEGKFNLHQRAYALKNFQCIPKFIYYTMDLLSDILSTKAVRSTVLSLRLPILENFVIQAPKGIEEQQKIADCLSSLDDLITAQAQKVEALKTHKKGLMQQLFPVLDDAIG